MDFNRRVRKSNYPSSAVPFILSLAWKFYRFLDTYNPFIIKTLFDQLLC